MIRYVDPDRSIWRMLWERVCSDDKVIEERVSRIIDLVREKGDEALAALSLEIDGTDISGGIEVTLQEKEEAFRMVPEELKEAMRAAMSNIRAFHEAQVFAGVDLQTGPGVRCVQKSVPLQRVGLYIPGGTAPLFSTVLMLGVPASVAGCREVVLCTPCGRDGKVAPAVLYAAEISGVGKVYKIGGAQAVAAMAYGTGTIQPVDKIFGPGNRYVTKAKEMVSRDVAIDMPAGPSEVLVMADDTAVPAFVASDLLSQAEHGADSQVILVCDNPALADEVEREVEKQLEMLPRKELARKALGNSRVIILPDPEDRVDFVNGYAPEHLIISVAGPWEVADRITAAGSVFIGNHTPESAGDYASGTNHTLPTSGWARSMSGVNTDSFVRKITYQEITKEGIGLLADTISTMARAEGLDAHANAALIRVKDI